MAQIQPIAASLLFQLKHGMTEMAQPLLIIRTWGLLQTQIPSTPEFEEFQGTTEYQ